MESVTTQGLFLFDTQFRSWGTVNFRFLGSWKQGPRGQRFDFGQTQLSRLLLQFNAIQGFLAEGHESFRGGLNA